MRIERCKWYNDASSPVLFMIDDLTSAWVDMNGSGSVTDGGDWGYFMDEEHSSFRFLMERILEGHPEVKVTFFVPVGTRVGMIQKPVCRMIAKPINADEASKAFFRRIHRDPRFELAYHGTTHGVVGETAGDFVQEWASFASLGDAIGRIREGIDIFADAVGESPAGGKYCGYTSNDFSDASVDESGFRWWCRYWNRGRADGSTDPSCGPDGDPATNYDVKRFGPNGVIDIPSTVNGALLNGLYHGRRTPKRLVKHIFKRAFIRFKLREIDELLRRRLVISVQEHIAPSRDDGQRQSPNIYDDRESLLHIFGHLRSKNVWYCTCTELADYVDLRDRVVVEQTESGGFELRHADKDRGRMLTLRFSDPEPKGIRLPGGSLRKVENGIATLPILEGMYAVLA